MTNKELVTKIVQGDTMLLSKHYDDLIRLAESIKDKELQHSLYNIIEASLPNIPIESQLIRWMAHKLKTKIMKKVTVSWQVSMDDAIEEIKHKNNKKKGNKFYFDLTEILDMAKFEFKKSLTWAVKDCKLNKVEQRKLNLTFESVKLELEKVLIEQGCTQ